MKIRHRFITFSLVFILLFLLSVSPSQAQINPDFMTSNQTNSIEANDPWQSRYVHQQINPPLNVGSHLSLALRPFDEIPYISYYDATNGDLMLAHLIPNGGGNCGTNNTWYCEVLDSAGDVGTYSSIDFWPEASTGTWKIGISYHDETNRGLKFTSWSCSGQRCTDRTTVMIAHSDDDKRSHGLSTSFKFTTDGTPHIAYYYYYMYGDQQLRYASYVASGGNCGEDPYGTWTCEMVNYGQGVGQYPSLDFPPSNSPHIAFYDGNLQRLLLAHRPTPGGNCGDNPRWLCEIVDDTVGDDVGKYVSHVWRDGEYFAYYDQTHGMLKFFSYDLFNVPMYVDYIGWSNSPIGISMAVDNDGLPIIAYQQVGSNPPALRIARPYLAYDDGNFGNCGETPPGMFFLYWRCTSLDNGSLPTEEADYVSLVASSAGLVSIAYSEEDVNYGTTSLKFIYQFQQTFLPILNKH